MRRADGEPRFLERLPDGGETERSRAPRRGVALQAFENGPAEVSQRLDAPILRIDPAAGKHERVGHEGVARRPAPHQHLNFPARAAKQNQRGGVARSHKAFLKFGSAESAGFHALPTGASIAAAARGEMQAMAKAFDGVRVIDFTQVIAGPFCTQHLAMMGADVIKLEQRIGGDQGRHLIGDNDLGRVGMSPMFLSINSGKRALTLDLKHPRAREVVHRLVAGANIVVENFKAGTMDRLGFGYEALKAIRPGLVFCSISGYGQTGAYAGAPAYDGAIQAASGMMSVTGHPDTGPVRAGFTAVDLSTGITAAFACASALYRQKATGEGQHLDVTMFESSLSMLAPLLIDYLTTGNMARPVGNSSPARIPTADSFRVKDGSLLMTCLTERQWKGLCEALGRPGLLTDPRFADDEKRRANEEALRAELEEAFAADTPDGWEERLAAAGVPAAPINDISQALDHPALAERRFVERRPGPTGIERDVYTVNPAFLADTDGPGTARPPPEHGAHSHEILSEIGYSESEIRDLREAGAV